MFSRFGLSGFGAEQSQQTTEAAKGAAEGAAAGGSIAGGLGAAVGAVAGAALKIAQGIGLASKARAGRTGAQDALVKYLEASRTYRDETKQFAGKGLPEASYNDFLTMATNIKGNALESAKSYRTAAGI